MIYLYMNDDIPLSLSSELMIYIYMNDDIPSSLASEKRASNSSSDDNESNIVKPRLSRSLKLSLESELNSLQRSVGISNAFWYP